MDAVLGSAIAAVHLPDDASAQRWFELICATHDQLAESAGPPDWATFSSALAENAGSAGVDPRTVEQFVEHLTANDLAPAETVERMVQLRTDLPAHHAELTAAGHAEQHDTDGTNTNTNTGTDDTAAWQAFLPEHGSRWDGSDASWDQFRTWFLYEAGQQGAATSAAAFIAYAESQPDRVAVFEQYGLKIATPAGDGSAADTSPDESTVDVSAYPEVKPGDAGEWVDYLDAMLTRHGF